MQRAFPHAVIAGHEDLIGAMRNDAKDRHVLAAAVRAGASAIVTANLKDFPASALQPYDVEALHPDDFLLDLLDLDRPVLLQLLNDQARAYVNPPVSLSDLRSQLSGTVPRFAAAAAASPVPEGMPLPLEVVAPAQLFGALGGYDRTTPLSAVAWWWKLLEDPGLHASELSDAVSDPSAWAEGFAAAATRLRGLSMTTVVEPGDQEPRRTVWVMFVDLPTSTTARLLAPIPTLETRWVEVVQSADHLWRVAGLVERPGGPLRR